MCIRDRSGILKLDELVEYTTLCYMQSGLCEQSPFHVRELWNKKLQTRENLRNNGIRLQYVFSQKQWINNLAPVQQVKLWNNCTLEKDILPSTFKQNCKMFYITDYMLEERKRKIDEQK